MSPSLQDGPSTKRERTGDETLKKTTCLAGHGAAVEH